MPDGSNTRKSRQSHDKAPAENPAENIGAQPVLHPIECLFGARVCRQHEAKPQHFDTFGQFAAHVLDTSGPDRHIASPEDKTRLPYLVGGMGKAGPRTLLTLDVDGKNNPPAFDELCRSLDAAGFAGLAYTTARHTPAAPRYRVLLPLARPLEGATLRETLKSATLAFAALLGIEAHLDDKSWAPSQCMFLPARVGGIAPQTHTVSGPYFAPPAQADEPAPPPPVASPPDPHATADDVRQMLRCVPPTEGTLDEYQPWLEVGMALHHQFEGGGVGLDLWKEWSSQSDKYDEGVCDKKWGSFGNAADRAPKTLASLRDLARKNGYRDIVGARADFAADSPAPDEADEPQAKTRPPAQLPAFNLESLGEFVNGAGPIDDLIEGLLRANSITALLGGPNVGKSAVAIGMAMSVATGIPFAGCAAARVLQRGPVVYIAAEGGQGMRNRALAWIDHHLMADTAEAPIYFLDGAVRLFQRDQAQGFVESVRAKFGRTPVKLLVVDTYARNHGGKENAAEDVSQLFENLAYVLRELGESRKKPAAALVLAHPPKGGTMFSVRGSGSADGTVDEVLPIEIAAPSAGGSSRITEPSEFSEEDGYRPPPSLKDARKITFHKSRDGSTEGAFHVSFALVRPAALRGGETVVVDHGRWAVPRGGSTARQSGEQPKGKRGARQKYTDADLIARIERLEATNAGVKWTRSAIAKKIEVDKEVVGSRAQSSEAIRAALAAKGVTVAAG